MAVKASNSGCTEEAFNLAAHLVFLQDFMTFGNLLDVFQTVGQNERRISKSKKTQQTLPS